MKQTKVLMMGAHRQVKGGISEVVNGYYASGLDQKVKLKYIATMHDRSNGMKIIFFVKGLLQFIFCVQAYDLIHIHLASRVSFQRKCVFIKIAQLLKKPYIIHLHGAEFQTFYWDESNLKQQKKISRVFDGAKAVIVLSESWKDFVGGMSSNKNIHVLYNSVTCPEVTYQFNKDILFLGRVGDRKGLYDLLDIFPEIVKKHESAMLYVGGDGDIAELNRRVAQQGLQEHVTYLGWIKNNEKLECLKKCATFVLPSYNEGLPMALLEAMAYRCTPITTHVGGIPEVVHDGETGYLIRPGDQEVLYQRLDQLLSSPDLHRKLSENAYQMIHKHFNSKDNIDQLVNVYA